MGTREEAVKIVSGFPKEGRRSDFITRYISAFVANPLTAREVGEEKNSSQPLVTNGWRWATYVLWASLLVGVASYTVGKINAPVNAFDGLNRGVSRHKHKKRCPIPPHGNPRPHSPATAPKGPAR